MDTNNKHILAIIFLLLVIAGGAYLIINNKNSPVVTGGVCTMEAKLCPDGSYVGRSGPSCEFAACPTDNISMKTYTDPQTGISFSYPEKISPTYIRTPDWPPKLQLLNQPFACNPAGSQTAQAGKTASLARARAQPAVHTLCMLTHLRITQAQ